MRIVIFGAGENGVQALVCLRRAGEVEVVGFLDGAPGKKGTRVAGLEVFGGTEEIPRLKAEAGVTGALVAIGDNYHRARLTAEIRPYGLQMVSAIHPWALVESPRRIGVGCIIEMGAAVHVDADVGEGVFLGGGSVVSHQSTVGDFCLLGGGAVFGGHVTIGPRTLIGVGAKLKPHISIGADVVVGVGSVVVKDVPDRTMVAGVPARVIRTLEPRVTETKG
jgi:sugar O-acyltransferase (sialic acid O-acetyltransferase NeuD family)